MVIYKEPWKAVRDDDGHTLHRGKRMAVCDTTFGILTEAEGPYGKDINAVLPVEEVPIGLAAPFDCEGSGVRDPRETKGRDCRKTRLSEGSSPCEGEGCC